MLPTHVPFTSQDLSTLHYSDLLTCLLPKLNGLLRKSEHLKQVLLQVFVVLLLTIVHDKK